MKYLTRKDLHVIERELMKLLADPQKARQLSAKAAVLSHNLLNGLNALYADRVLRIDTIAQKDAVLHAAAEKKQDVEALKKEFELEEAHYWSDKRRFEFLRDFLPRLETYLNNLVMFGCEERLLVAHFSSKAK